MSSDPQISESLSQGMADVGTFNRPFKRYTIPRKERLPSKDCQRPLPVNSREAKEIENAVKRLTWDTSRERAVLSSQITKVDNPFLEREYQEKKSQLREEGRSTKELTEQLAFRVETDLSRVKGICQSGLRCDGVDHTLGDGNMGVSVWRCPDLCLRGFTWPNSEIAYLVVFKIVKGRLKFVTPMVSSLPNLEPTPNCDCHIARHTALLFGADLATLLQRTQYYLYEYNEEGLPSKRPRHCLPFAVISLKKVNNTEGSQILNLPMASPEKSPSTAKASSKPSEDAKMPLLREEDGIMAWRGLVTSNEKNLGWTTLLAGHKLGFNFWASYLDITKKIAFRNLKLMLPGDLKSAWRKPLPYRNRVISLCTMKVVPGQPREAFTNFTRNLAAKAKAGGVVVIDSATTMLLIPSSQLAIRFGFCDTKEPPRMFCAVFRRQSAPVWPQTRSSTSPPDNSTASTIESNTGLRNDDSSPIKVDSLNFTAQHKCKIVVSSSEKRVRLSPKHPRPRNMAKRSLSFSCDPGEDLARTFYPRVSRRASTGGTVDGCGGTVSGPREQAEVELDAWLSDGDRSTVVERVGRHTVRNTTSHLLPPPSISCRRVSEDRQPHTEAQHSDSRDSNTHAHEKYLVQWEAMKKKFCKYLRSENTSTIVGSTSTCSIRTSLLSEAEPSHSETVRDQQVTWPSAMSMTVTSTSEHPVFCASGSCDAGETSGKPLQGKALDLGARDEAACTTTDRNVFDSQIQPVFDHSQGVTERETSPCVGDSLTMERISEGYSSFPDPLLFDLPVKSSKRECPKPPSCLDDNSMIGCDALRRIDPPSFNCSLKPMSIGENKENKSTERLKRGVGHFTVGRSHDTINIGTPAEEWTPHKANPFETENFQTNSQSKVEATPCNAQDKISLIAGTTKKHRESLKPESSAAGQCGLSAPDRKRPHETSPDLEDTASHANSLNQERVSSSRGVAVSNTRWYRPPEKRSKSVVTSDRMHGEVLDFTLLPKSCTAIDELSPYGFDGGDCLDNVVNIQASIPSKNTLPASAVGERSGQVLCASGRDAPDRVKTPTSAHNPGGEISSHQLTPNSYKAYLSHLNTLKGKTYVGKIDLDLSKQNTYLKHLNTLKSKKVVRRIDLDLSKQQTYVNHLNTLKSNTFVRKTNLDFSKQKTQPSDEVDEQRQICDLVSKDNNVASDSQSMPLQAGAVYALEKEKQQRDKSKLESVCKNKGASLRIQGMVTEALLDAREDDQARIVLGAGRLHIKNQESDEKRSNVCVEARRSNVCGLETSQDARILRAVESRKRASNSSPFSNPVSLKRGDFESKKVLAAGMCSPKESERGVGTSSQSDTPKLFIKGLETLEHSTAVQNETVSSSQVLMTDLCPATHATAMVYSASLVREPMAAVLPGKDPLAAEDPVKEPVATKLPSEDPLTEVLPAQAAADVSVQDPMARLLPGRELMTRIQPAKRAMKEVTPAQEPVAAELSVKGPIARMYPGRELMTRIQPAKKAMKEVTPAEERNIIRVPSQEPPGAPSLAKETSWDATKPLLYQIAGTTACRLDAEKSHAETKSSCKLPRGHYWPSERSRHFAVDEPTSYWGWMSPTLLNRRGNDQQSYRCTDSGQGTRQMDRERLRGSVSKGPFCFPSRELNPLPSGIFSQIPNRTVLGNHELSMLVHRQPPARFGFLPSPPPTLVSWSRPSSVPAPQSPAFRPH